MIFSCIIPAYNEWTGITKILEMVLACTELDEIIVINDGSTDNTQEIIDQFSNPKLKKIHLKKNSGKLRAFFEGVKEAIWTHIVMMDADYVWFTTEHLSRLIQPIKNKDKDSTMMMWSESLWICKILKHDTFSGARVLPKSVFDRPSYFLDGKGFWLETKINEILYERRLSVLSLSFPEVHNPSKGIKQLLWRQPIDILSSMPLWKIIRQAWYFYRQQP